jgi:hypothetical protein
MSTTSRDSVPNQFALEGTSAFPPSLTGDSVFGILVAWTDQEGQIYLATDRDNPPYRPVITDSNWRASSTPAVTLSVNWARVYLAWTDTTGMIHVANSGAGWKDVPVAEAGSPEVDFAPALTVSDDLLYIAWKTTDSLLNIATCDFRGDIKWHPTGKRVLSRPSLTWHDGTLYVLSGGTLTTPDEPMSIYRSTDKGETFEDVALQPTTSLGPPALAVIEDYYYLVWADAKTSRLNFAATKSLEQFDVISYADGCHEGGPSVLGLPDGLVVGWSFGAPPNDSRSHHITVGTLSLAAPARALGTSRYVHLTPALIETKHCDPLSVYDPAEDKCVPKGGCDGKCVYSSITTFAGLILFDPIKYAICMYNCTKQR